MKEKEIVIGENFWCGFCVVIFLYEKFYSFIWYIGGKSKKRVEWESWRKEEKRKMWIGKYSFYLICMCYVFNGDYFNWYD